MIDGVDVKGVRQDEKIAVCWYRKVAKAGKANAISQSMSRSALKARVILIPCTNDLYFPPEDNAFEFRYLANAELRPYDSPWGHCVANPGNDPKFEKFLDDCIDAVLRAADE